VAAAMAATGATVLATRIARRGLVVEGRLSGR